MRSERRSQLAVRHTALFFAQFAFGLLPVFGTLAFAPGAFSPLGVGSWRIAGGAFALGLLAFAAYGRDALPAKGDLFRLSLCALLGVVLNQGLFLIGLARSTPMNAGLVMSLIPVFTFGIAAAVRQEEFEPLRAAGVTIALLGAALLLVGRGGGLFSGTGFGNALMVLNAFSFSIYLVISRPLLQRYRSLTFIAWVYILSLPFLPVFMVGQRLVPDPGFEAAWWSLAYIVLFPTVIAYLLNMFALARLRASTTAVYVYLQPLIAGLSSWVVFSERPTAGMAGSAALLFVGIWLVARRPLGDQGALAGG